MAGMVWRIVKTAATNIPWGRIVENAPVVVDMVERVKERIRNAPQHDPHAQFKALQEENLRLADSLLKTTKEIEELQKILQVVVARVKMLTVVTTVSLLIAVASLVAWLVR